MKKHFLGLAAILFAIGAASFTKIQSNPSNFDSVFFQYTPGANPFTEADVENPANWVQVVNITTGCNNNDQQACRIEVDISDTDGTSPKTLKSTVDIIANQYLTSGNFFVTQAGDVVTARNRSIPL